MLTTGDLLKYDEYQFKDSPDSSNDSFMTDGIDLNSEEDFLQQLSADLDIPLLLNPNEDEFGMLNSILNYPPDEILSPVPAINYQDTSNEINDLQNLDVTQWGPEAFPNLIADNVKSESPTPSHSSEDSRYCEVKDEIIIDTPPISPNNNCHSNFVSPVNDIRPTIKRNIFANKGCVKSKKRITLSPTNSVSSPTILPIPVSLNNNVLVIENTKVPITPLNTVPTSNSTTTNLVQIGKLNTCIPLNGVPLIVNQSNGLINNVSEMDARAFKRQQRMIKNRESAILSRKKKKEYLNTLEKQVQELSLENAHLKKENADLRERLSMLSQNITSVFKVPNKTFTKSMALCIFLFVVCLNLDFASKKLNLKSNNVIDSTVQLSNHHTRSLLWTPDVENEKSINETANIVSLPICPMYVNQTESVRLALELHRWIGKPYNDSSNTENDYQMKPKPSKMKYRSKLKYKARSDTLNTPILSSVYRMGKRSRNIDEHVASNELQLFEPTPEQLYAEFFEAINRKEDTFYVVSFNADHMLLPALHHNKTRRPKMSLILPSMIANDTENHTSGVSLMQIDCEVIDTRLINIKDKAIPQHFKPTGNTTTSTKHNKMNERHNQKLKKPYKPYFMNKMHNSTFNVHKLP